MVSLSEWQTLFSTQASAAATLTGLVFVAVSINLAKVIAHPGLPARAAESLLQFLQVFFVCMAAMIPRQSTTALAIEILAVASISWTFQTIGLVRYAKVRSGHPRWWLVLRVLQTQFAGLPFFVAAACLLFAMPAGLYWLVAGFFFSFVSGLLNSWILLVEIVR